MPRPIPSWNRPPPEMVEHADLFHQPDRIVERQDVDQRPEQHRPRPLGDGGEEYAGRGCHAQRRRVVLRHVVAVDSRRLVTLHHPEAVFVELGERDFAAAVDVVEDAEFHRRAPGPAARRATSARKPGPAKLGATSVPIMCLCPLPVRAS